MAPGDDIGGQVQTTKTEELIIVVFLACIATLCIGGIILLQVVLEDPSANNASDALLTIGSLCVGALAGRISQAGSREPLHTDDEEAYEILGRAATRQLVADALRKMSEGP